MQVWIRKRDCQISMWVQCLCVDCQQRLELLFLIFFVRWRTTLAFASNINGQACLQYNKCININLSKVPFFEAKNMVIDSYSSILLNSMILISSCHLLGFHIQTYEFYVVCNDDTNLSILSAWTHKYQFISLWNRLTRAAERVLRAMDHHVVIVPILQLRGFASFEEQDMWTAQ